MAKKGAGWEESEESEERAKEGEDIVGSFLGAKCIDRILRVGRPLSRCIQMMNYEYRSWGGKGTEGPAETRCERDGGGGTPRGEKERPAAAAARGGPAGTVGVERRGRWRLHRRGGRKIIRVTPGAKSEFTNEMCRRSDADAAGWSQP